MSNGPTFTMKIPPAPSRRIPLPVAIQLAIQLGVPLGFALSAAPSLAAPGAAASKAEVSARSAVQRPDEWNYVVAPRDTLIGLVTRLMKPTADWQKLQQLNQFANPHRLAPGGIVRIPVDWLRSDATIATVELAQGAVSVRRGSNRLGSIVTGTEVLPGDKIETGVQSTLTLRFVDTSRVVIAPQSKVLIENLLVYGKSGITETRLRIEEGGIDSAVKPMVNSASRYVVTTPVFNLGVRGTDFRARFDPATNFAFNEVLTGAVATQGKQSEVRIGAGFGTLALVNTEPKPPIRLLDAPLLQGIAKAASQLPVALNWEPEAGATAYRAQLFTDRSFQRQLVEGVFTQPQARWLNLPDGAYVVRVRSIDAEGLEGASTASDFVLKARPFAPFSRLPQNASSVTGNAVLLKWTEPPVARAYRLQVSDTADFRAPRIDRSDLTAPELALALPPGTYYWRVATIAADADQGPFSDVQSIVLIPGP